LSLRQDFKGKNSFALSWANSLHEILCPPKVVERITLREISWKLNWRSCFKTKLDAFKLLTDIVHTFLRVREGLHAEAFEDGVLETTLTNTMEQI
jgi:hypothetical protein